MTVVEAGFTGAIAGTTTDGSVVLPETDAVTIGRIQFSEVELSFEVFGGAPPVGACGIGMGCVSTLALVGVLVRVV